MSPSVRDEARKEREEARRRRRAEPEAEQADSAGTGDGDANGTLPDEGPESGHSTSLDSLRGAATVAAAGAAVGAAFGAARALTTRDGRQDEEAQHGEDDAERTEPGVEDAPPEPDAEREPEADVDTEAQGGEPEPDDEPELPQSHDESRQLAGSTPDETSDVVARARAQLAALHGAEPESISSLERTEDGWRATFEVLELARVPDSTDVLASYEVVLDEDKNVTRYARLRRYYRAQADHEGAA